jgi:hypothetical protein
MKSDKLLISAINFLSPLVLLCAFFVLADYVNNGFFAVFYSAILVLSSFAIYSLRFFELKLPSLTFVNSLSKIGAFIAMIYLIAILLLLVGN